MRRTFTRRLTRPGKEGSAPSSIGLCLCAKRLRRIVLLKKTRSEEKSFSIRVKFNTWRKSTVLFAHSRKALEFTQASRVTLLLFPVMAGLGSGHPRLRLFWTFFDTGCADQV